MDAILAPPAAASPRPAFRTWQLYLALLAATLAVAWAAQAWVMTDDVYRGLLADRLDAARVDEALARRADGRAWGLALVPLLLWARLAFVALSAQLVLLLLVLDVPFGRLFRAAAWAYAALLCGQAARWAWLARLGTDGITREALGVTPGSLAAALLDPSAPAGLYQLFSMLSVWEAAWCAVFALGLRRAGQIAPATAAGVAAAVWMLLAVLKLSVTLYVLRMG